MRKNLSILFLIMGIILSVGSFGLVKTDKDFVFRWAALGSYLFSVIFVFLAFFCSALGKRVRGGLRFDWVDAKYLVVVLTISIALSFVMLKSFPFVSVGDELRDGGLEAMEIAQGGLKNIFGYGRYDAHGLIIPTFTSLFFRVFGSSVLTYRVPAAIIGVFCVLLVYLAARLAAGKVAGFWAALVLATLPLHLFYSRTEVVVIFSSLLSLVIVLLFFIFVKNRTWWSYVILATGLGLSVNFHASVKATALIVILLVMVIYLRDLVLARGRSWQKIFVFIIFFLIGFGPRLLFTPLDIFFHTNRYGLKGGGLTYEGLLSVGEKYIKSLLVWGSEQTTAWYPDHKPIFPVLLVYFLILGMAVSLVKKNIYLSLLIVVLLVSHLTNSAITDMVNGDHRLSPLFPMGALFVGIGINWFLMLIKSNGWRMAIVVGLAGYLIISGLLFFWYQKANLGRTMLDYVSMNTVYYLRGVADEGKFLGRLIPICFVTSSDNAENFNHLHYQEQYRFLLPEYTVEVKKSDNLLDNKIYIFEGNCQKISFDKEFKGYNLQCERGSLYCPLGYEKEIVVRSQR